MGLRVSITTMWVITTNPICQISSRGEYSADFRAESGARVHKESALALACCVGPYHKHAPNDQIILLDKFKQPFFGHVSWSRINSKEDKA